MFSEEGRRGGAHVEVAHLVLTRFSVKATDDAPPFAIDWLEDRLALFEAYCLPGMVGQTCADFRWLLFCDESTDRGVLDRLRHLVRAVPDTEVLTVGAGRSTLARMLSGVAESAELLMTTRLDSDDGLALRYVERLQEYATPFWESGNEALLINFQHGYKLTDGGELHANFNPHSAFLTLFERLRADRVPRSVQTGNHGHLHFETPLHQDASMVGWLQVVHGGNVSNRVLAPDLPVPRALLDHRFAVRPQANPRQSPVPAPQPAGADERAAFRQRLEEALVPHRPAP